MHIYIHTDTRLLNTLTTGCVGTIQAENLAKASEVLEVAGVPPLLPKIVRECSILCHSLLVHWPRLQCHQRC